jgi:hypothetical protein
MIKKRPPQAHKSTWKTVENAIGSRLVGAFFLFFFTIAFGVPDQPENYGKLLVGCVVCSFGPLLLTMKIYGLFDVLERYSSIFRLCSECISNSGWLLF